MTLADSIRKFQRRLLTSTIQVEAVARSYSASTGEVRTGRPTVWTVSSSEVVGHRRRFRPDSTAPAIEAYVYVPVPAEGLPFTPELGQVVIANGERWLVVAVAPRRVSQTTIGYRLDLAAGA